jgi:2'-5' RNA ligase
VGAAEEALAALAAPDRAAPRLGFAGPLLLPRGRPRVLTAALTDPDGTLAALQAEVSDSLAGAGVYTPERRAFRPHVTVARLRPRARPSRTVKAELGPLEFAGTAVTLFSSRTSPHGARYEPLWSLGLETGRKAD